MEDKIEEWLKDRDYSNERRVLLIDLFKDFVCWCYDKGYCVKELTINGLSKTLVGLGYIKVQSYNGMYFLMGEGQVCKREEVGDGK